MHARSIATAAAVSASLLLFAACSSSISEGRLAPTPAHELSALERNPESAGQRIYEGRVYSLDTVHRTPLYWYDRRVREDAGQLVSTHITRDSVGTVVVTQVAHHDDRYNVTSANLVQAQSGIAGSVEVRDGQFHFTLIKNGRTTTATERADAPLVTGPTTFGYIVTHWDSLAHDRPLRVRFAVLESNRSIEFALQRISTVDGTTTVRMVPTSWLIRRLVAPQFFYFDTGSRKVLGYDGRVPPLDVSDGKLRALDARVRYTHHALNFR